MHVQREFFRIRRRDTGAHLDYALKFQTGWSDAAYSWSREAAEQILADIKAGNGPAHFTYGVLDQLEIYPVPICGVCGAWQPELKWDKGIYRCSKHAKRNACAIEGCSRSAATEHAPGNDQWLCGEHWRAFVPPRSAIRRAYHRIFRLAKKNGGWTPELKRRFWRLWHAIVRRARHAHSGQFEAFVDEAEINKMFGWE